MTGNDDPLDGVPPTRQPRAASSSGSSSFRMPRPSAAAMSLTGAGPTANLGMKMMALEKLAAEVSKEIPELANLFGPAIELMRDLGAARMASHVSGGVGATNPEAAASPMGGAAVAPIGPGAGGGMPIPPVPMI